MPLGTLGREPPPFFRQGPSALSKLAVCSALAIFLMVADPLFKAMRLLRVSLATAFYPLQWVAMRPVVFFEVGGQYLEAMTATQTEKDAALKRRSEQSQRVNQVDQLSLENVRLRKLLGLRDRLQSHSMAAQVIYDAADPYSRKVIVDKGMTSHVALGSPVLDESGVLGQVTRVYPLVSEVTLITDRDHAIPVLNTRTGARGVAFGDVSGRADAMELRFMAANADVAVGDLLSTSGVDGVYPPGLPVAKVQKIERRVDAIFARIYCTPLAAVSGATYVLLLDTVENQIPARPEPEAATPPAKRGAAK